MGDDVDVGDDGDSNVYDYCLCGLCHVRANRSSKLNNKFRPIFSCVLAHISVSLHFLRANNMHKIFYFIAFIPCLMMMVSSRC